MAQTSLIHPSDSDSGSGGTKGPEFVQCIDGQETQMHEVWCFGLKGITHEVHPTVQVDVGAGVIGEFLYNYLTKNGRRIPILGKFQLMEMLNNLKLPASTELVDLFGMTIYWIHALVREAVVPIKNGEFGRGTLQ